MEKESTPRTFQHSTGSAAPGSYVVEPLQPTDTEAVARVHVASFGDSFLAQLGPAALKHYFRAFLEHQAGCGMVCRYKPTAEIVGFVCGAEDVGRHYRTLLRRRLLPMAPALLARVAQEPQITLDLLVRARRVASVIRLRGSRASGPAVSLPKASLMTIGVHPAHRGRGLGALLVQTFTAEMARRGVPALKLGVRDENATARRLYERLGWRPLTAEDALDRAAGWIYVRELEHHADPRPDIARPARELS